MPRRLFDDSAGKKPGGTSDAPGKKSMGTTSVGQRHHAATKLERQQQEKGATWAAIAEEQGLPRFVHYAGEREGGRQAIAVIIGPITLYFSYGIIIAFRYGRGKTTLSMNMVEGRGHATQLHIDKIGADNDVMMGEHVEREKFLEQLKSFLSLHVVD